MTFGSAWVEPCTGNPYARFGRAVPAGNCWSDSTVAAWEAMHA